MPPLKSRFRPDLFETRTDVWRSAGLGDEVEPAEKRRWRGGLLVALLVIAAALVVYGRRSELAPGYEAWVRVGTVGVLVIAGSAAATWLGRWVSPTFYRRLDPAAAGTVGFLVRLVSLSIVVVAALRIAGVTMGTLAVGGAFTAIILGLAAQQTIGNVLARDRPPGNQAVPGRPAGQARRRCARGLAGGNRQLARALLHARSPRGRIASGFRTRCS